MILDEKPVLSCDDFRKVKYKTTHVVTGQTTQFVVNFYDITVDEDPMSALAYDKD